MHVYPFAATGVGDGNNNANNVKLGLDIESGAVHSAQLDIVTIFILLSSFFVRSGHCKLILQMDSRCWREGR